MKHLPRLLSTLLATAPLQAAEPPPYRQWGDEAIRVLHQDLWLPEKKLYAEKANVETGKPDHPSFMWGVGVQLSAFAAAAAVEPDRFMRPMKNYAEEIQSYWWEAGGIAGYDVLPGPKKSDRYYDDNAWLVLALAEVYELTKEPKYLERSEATFRFVMSGEDEKLGGGLYWRELEKTTKNTCTNAPAIVSALRLHRLTGKKEHLETARRIHRWTQEKLQDQDGLYFDHLRMDGGIDRRKYSYNTALMIRASCLFHEITGETAHLEEAQRVARAAEKHWIRESGAMGDSGFFAHLLLESLLELHRRDRDPRWLEVVERCVKHLHASIRDPNGRYPNRWDRPPRGPLREVTLLNQASSARIFWVAAKELVPR